MKRRFKGKDVANMVDQIMKEAGIDKAVQLTPSDFNIILFSIAESCYLMGQVEALGTTNISKSN